MLLQYHGLSNAVGSAVLILILSVFNGFEDLVKSLYKITLTSEYRRQKKQVPHTNSYRIDTISAFYNKWVSPASRKSCFGKRGLSEYHLFSVDKRLSQVLPGVGENEK